MQHEIERSSDPLDHATQRTEVETERLLYHHANRPKQAVVLDNHNNKLCADCGERIPSQRAKIALVTRCFDCQSHNEKLINRRI